MSFYASMMAGLKKSRLEQEEEVEKNMSEAALASSFDEEDELQREDSYDEMMSNTKMFPQISAPSIAPLNPFDSPSEASHNETNKPKARNPLDYSLETDGGNTMSSYYTNNGWDHTAGEEDDDEDSDYGKSDVLNLLEQDREVTAPKRRVTRMRSKSIENGSAVNENSEKKKKRKSKKKKSKKSAAATTSTGRERSNSYGKYSSSELNYGALFPSTHTLREPSEEIEVLSLNDVDEDDEDDGDGESDSGASGSDEDMDSYDGTEEPTNASLERSGGSSVDISKEQNPEDEVMEFNMEESIDIPPPKVKTNTNAKSVQFNNVSTSSLSPKADSSIDLSDNDVSKDEEDNFPKGAKRHSVLSDDESDTEYKPSVSRSTGPRRDPLDASVDFSKGLSNEKEKQVTKANPLDSDSDDEQSKKVVSKDTWATQPTTAASNAPIHAQGSPQRPVVKMPSTSPAPSYSRNDRQSDLDLGESLSPMEGESRSSRRDLMTEQEKAEDKRLRIERIKANTIKARQEREQQFGSPLSPSSPSKSEPEIRDPIVKKAVSQNRVSFEQNVKRPPSELSINVHHDEAEVDEHKQEVILPIKLYEDHHMAPHGSSSSPRNQRLGSPSNRQSPSHPLSSSVNKNPLYNSASSFHTDYSNQSEIKENNAILCSLPITLELPPLSEYAAESGVICEGYLSKKSSVTGLFQKRYFVLSESATYFAVLRIYSKAVTTSWGVVPINLRSSIPIGAVESVTTTATPASKGIEFVIKFSPAAFSSKNPESGRFGGSQAGSENGSVFSAAFGAAESKQTILHAEDAENRLLWVTILNKVLSIFLDNLPE